MHRLNPANIPCANCSDELLGILAQTFPFLGDEAIFTKRDFSRPSHPDSCRGRDPSHRAGEGFPR